MVWASVADADKETFDSLTEEAHPHLSDSICRSDWQVGNSGLN